jgi:glycosyltransferase 2 family protein
MTKRAQRWLGLGLTALVLGLITFWQTRNTDWRTVWLSMAHARLSFLLLAVIATYLSYLVRAVRWKYFLDPIKSGSLWILFAGQILGFSAIFLLPFRLGEVVRPAYIAKKEDVPLASQFAIVVLERFGYDSVAVVLLLGLALSFQPIHPSSARAAAELHRMREVAKTVLLFTGILIAALVAFRLESERLIAWVERSFAFLPKHVRQTVEGLLRHLAQGLDAIRNWRDLVASVVWTVVLWLLNTTVFWLVFRSLGGELRNASWWVAAITIFFAGVGLLVQLPGVGGGFPLATKEALRRIFHVSGEAATSAGILLWVVILVPCVALALVILLLEGLSFRKLREIAEEQKARSTVGSG